MVAGPVKTSELPQVGSMDGMDRLVVLSQVDGVLTTSTISLQDLTANSHAVSVLSVSPDHSNTEVVVSGSVMTDGDYLYVATANNVLKRVALSTF